MASQAKPCSREPPNTSKPPRNLFSAPTKKTHPKWVRFNWPRAFWQHRCQSVAPPTSKRKNTPTFRTVLARTSEHLKATPQSLLCANEKNAPEMGAFSLAQRRGFEPPVRFRRTHDFQSCSLNHSDISAIFSVLFHKAPIYITLFFQKNQVFLLHFAKIF